MSIFAAISAPAPAPPLLSLPEPRESDQDAPVPVGRADSVHIGAGSPGFRPQPAGKALPGNYDARGHREPTEEEEALAAEQAHGERAHDAAAPGELSSEEQAMVAELQARDVEVRAHEAAHAGVGGALAGGASYTYQEGPDGRRYAVGGEVPISIGGGGSPEEQAQNAAQVRRAALAPANPSNADRAIASRASQLEMEARAEIAEQARAEASEEAEAPEATTPPGTAEEPAPGALP